MSTVNTRIGELKNNQGGTGPVNIRSNPSLDAPSVQKPIGTRVTILGQTETGGYTWYNVQYDGNQLGWVRADVIKILSDVPTPTPTPTPQSSLLYFETNSRQVRVFNAGSAILMNVYNKKTNQTEVNRVEATRIQTGAATQASYFATQNGRAYQASFVRRGTTQLKITDSKTGLDIEPIESGFNQSGTEYVQEP